MNATVITTGPGVIIETATASMNCRSVSQWNWRTTPPYRNGTIASPLPNTKRLAPAKYVRSFQSRAVRVCLEDTMSVGGCPPSIGARRLGGQCPDWPGERLVKRLQAVLRPSAYPDSGKHRQSEHSTRVAER